MMRARLAAAVFSALVGVALGTVSGASMSPASAHTDLLSATPSSGTTVGGVPDSVQLEFSTPVQARLAQVVVSDERGENHVVGPVASFDARVVAQVQDLRSGRYTVAYRVVAADGHPVVGRYAFEVATGAGAPQAGAVGASVPAASTSQDGRPWLAPLVGGLVVVSVVGLRLHHGRRRAAP